MNGKDQLAKVKSTIGTMLYDFDGVEFYKELVKACAVNSNYTETIFKADHIFLEMLSWRKDENGK